MKQLAFLTLLICCIAGANAATVSGTVTNSVTGNRQPNIVVMIIDSFSSPLYFDWMRTDGNGDYSFTLPSTVSTGAQLTVSITDSCNMTYSATYTYSGASIVRNFAGCSAPTSFYDLSGRVLLPGAPTGGVRHFTAYLISKKYDPALMDTTLTAVDSFPTVSTNPTFHKRYYSLPAGQLLVKVALSPLDSEYVNYLPTYYDSALQWSSAKALTPANLTLPNVTNIAMKRATNPGGPGFIGGSVLLGANKSTAVGDPLSGRILILVNATTNKPVAYTRSNAAGKFNFSKLAYGTYKIFGDAAGKTNPMLTLTLSAAKPGYSNILFEENDKTFKGSIGNLSVAGVHPVLAAVSAYPVPAADYVEVGGLQAIAGSKTLVLSALNGAVISRQEVASGQTPRIATADLAPGMYLLQVQTSLGSRHIKLTK